MRLPLIIVACCVNISSGVCNSLAEVRVVDLKTKEEREEWTGSYIFENEWQSFRTKKDRKLELVSAEKEVEKGHRKIAIKVVDIFGNDTTKVLEVNIT